MTPNFSINPWAPELWTSPSVDKNTISAPKITVGILNFNRRDDLRRTLDCITGAIQYPDIEVIVVDNASIDKSTEMVRSEFPEVKLIALEKNIGTSARNYFYDQANGKYVFSFDDDSFPATPSTIYQAVQILEFYSHLDTLTFYCYQPITGFIETGEATEIKFSDVKKKEFSGLFYAEGAMCIKTSSWKKIIGYDPDFFWGSEGVDLTLQMYEKDMRAIYSPGLAVLHMKSLQNRDMGNNNYFFTRNHIWTLSKHFPLYACIPLISLYIIRKFIAICLYPKYTLPYLKGIKDGLLGIVWQRKKQKKLTLRQVLGLKRWYLFLYRW